MESFISQGSLYRGDQYKSDLEAFVALKKKYEVVPREERDNFCWVESAKVGYVGRIRNTAIGTLHDVLSSNSSGKETWNLSTNKFYKVSLLTLSPNYWNGAEVGNKHYFFILDGCKNPSPVRGFFNEYLRSELSQDRKTFEMLANKMKAPYSDNQLSGLGFSSTIRNSVICKVTGSFTRTIKVNF